MRSNWGASWQLGSKGLVQVAAISVRTVESWVKRRIVACDLQWPQAITIEELPEAGPEWTISRCQWIPSDSKTRCYIVIIVIHQGAVRTNNTTRSRRAWICT